MTTWQDYKLSPAENDSPPPVGAPEGMPTTQVNNTMREIMSVIFQLGTQMETAIDNLGSMASQNADAVAITGGAVTATLAGNGAGITNLQAQNLVAGPIPAAVFPADTAPLNVKVQRAVRADTVTSISNHFPIGSIILWWGQASNVPAGWHICDGNGGTPNLMGRFIRCCDGGGYYPGLMGGSASSAAVTDYQGTHSHGASTGGTALSVAQLPAHSHVENWHDSSGAGAYFNGPNPGGKYGNLYQNGTPTADTGGGQLHYHAIGNDGNHAHNVTVTVDPLYVAVWYIMRVV